MLETRVCDAEITIKCSMKINPKIKIVVKCLSLRLHRLGDQDAALSRLKPGFESLWRHTKHPPERGVIFLDE